VSEGQSRLRISSLAESDESEVVRTLKELQIALREHVQQLRLRLLDEVVQENRSASLLELVQIVSDRLDGRVPRQEALQTSEGVQ
jgi:hypothetical protein